MLTEGHWALLQGRFSEAAPSCLFPRLLIYYFLKIPLQVSFPVTLFGCCHFLRKESSDHTLTHRSRLAWLRSTSTQEPCTAAAWGERLHCSRPDKYLTTVNKGTQERRLKEPPATALNSKPREQGMSAVQILQGHKDFKKHACRSSTNLPLPFASVIQG